MRARRGIDGIWNVQAIKPGGRTECMVHFRGAKVGRDASWDVILALQADVLLQV